MRKYVLGWCLVFAWAGMAFGGDDWTIEDTKKFYQDVLKIDERGVYTYDSINSILAGLELTLEAKKVYDAILSEMFSEDFPKVPSHHINVANQGFLCLIKDLKRLQMNQLSDPLSENDLSEAQIRELWMRVFMHEKFFRMKGKSDVLDVIPQHIRELF